MRQRPSESTFVTTTTRFDESRLAVPRWIRLVGDGTSASLHWSIDGGWQHGEPVMDALTEFLRLVSADDPRAFLRFAERFGVLGIQADGWPGDPEASPGLPSIVIEDGVRWHVESLAAWKIYARHARAVVILSDALRRRVAALGPINAGAVLHDLGVGDDDNLWETLPPAMFHIVVSYAMGNLVHNLNRAREHGLDVQRVSLATAVTSLWLNRSHLTPRLTWEGDAPVLDLDVTTFMGQSHDAGAWSPFALFSVLTGQLVAALSNAGRYARCSTCGEFYVPSDRRPRLDRSHFCSAACRHKGEKKRKRESARQVRARDHASG